MIQLSEVIMEVIMEVREVREVKEVRELNFRKLKGKLKEEVNSLRSWKLKGR